MVNVYDSANQLQQDLEQSQQFQALKEAMAKVKANPEANQILQQLQAKQHELQQAQMQGKQIEQAQLDEVKALGQKVQSHPELTDLLTKEQALNQLIEDLNQVIFEPISRLYKEDGTAK